ncbi:unnamed protein product [Camellia sinensis]
MLAPPADHQMNISLYSSSSLAQLCFEGSLIKEDPMSTLEKLPNLRSLYLDEAFVGEKMFEGLKHAIKKRHLRIPKLKHLGKT